MSDKIYNHLTGRFIERYGSAHKKLLKLNLTNENNSNMKKKVKPKEKVSKKYYASDSEEEEEEEVVVKQKVKDVKPNKPEKKPEKKAVKSKKGTEKKIQDILNGLSKKQIEKMNDAQITSYVQKKFIEDCRITKDEEETEEEDNEEEEEEDFDSE
jgi:hypothetical protein